MDGLVKFLGKMPCLPSELKFRYYALPGLFGHHLGIQEATARLISYSQVAGIWVGVSRDRLVNDIQKEIENTAQATRNAKCYCEECEVDGGLNRYLRLLAINVGLAVFPLDIPKAKVYDAVSDMEKESAVQHSSLIHTFGGNLVVYGLQILIEEKLVRVGKSGPSEGVLFPSPELVNKIMEKYRIS